MKNADSASKITARHLERKAIVYLRQSSIAQVRHNVESRRLQYALKDTAKAYGFAQVEVIDVDLGMSASSGARSRCPRPCCTAMPPSRPAPRWQAPVLP